MTCVLNSFLGCFKLRTGCLIIGYFGSVGSGLGVIFSVGVVFITGIMKPYLEGDAKYTNDVILWVFVFLLVICSFYHGLYVTLLIGVHQKRPKLLKMFIQCMTIYLSMLFCVVMFVAIYMNTFRGLRGLVSIVSGIYCLLVIHSHYLELKEFKEAEEMQAEIKPV